MVNERWKEKKLLYFLEHVKHTFEKWTDMHILLAKIHLSGWFWNSVLAAEFCDPQSGFQ